MKYRSSFFFVILMTFFLTILLGGCQKEPAAFPFTSLTWDSTYEDMTALEGSEHEAYDSVYGGTTYTYPKEYLGRAGIIKYMFDGENALVCVAWAYSTDSEDELDKVYDTIHQKLVEEHGDSSYHTGNTTSSGDVWYLKAGDILISTMTTESQKALQYAYLHPAVSNQDSE